MINLDLLEIDDLQAYSDNLDNPPQLRNYAFYRALAVYDRRMGRIESATIMEKACQQIYANLPAKLKWLNGCPNCESRRVSVGPLSCNCRECGYQVARNP